MLSKLKFFVKSILHFSQVGTITQSGKKLSYKAASLLPYNKSITVVELGSGDGAITRAILHRISSDSNLIAIELNKEFCKALQNINDPRLIIENASVEEIDQILERHLIKQIDHVVSAIPFVIFSREKAKKIIYGVKRHIKSKGKWLQIHYATTILGLYKEIFGNVKKHRVFQNIPPAYVFESDVLKDPI